MTAPSSARRRLRSGRWLPILFVLPGMLLVAGILWPFLQGVIWAFSDLSLNRPDDARFNGGANIAAVFTPGTQQWKALMVSLRLAAACVVVQTLLGFAVAMLLNWPARWTRVFRVLVILPMLVPPIAATVIWKVMLVEKGIVNYALLSIGGASVNWFGDPSVAFWTIVLIDTWIFTPFAILILLAGLQSIPSEILEAATVDGAGFWARLTQIILPMTAPFLLLVVLFRGIDALKMFDVIWSSTKGGPVRSTTNLNVFAYEQGVTYLNYGKSMAVLFVLWVFCYALSAFLLRRRRAGGGA